MYLSNEKASSDRATIQPLEDPSPLPFHTPPPPLQLTALPSPPCMAPSGSSISSASSTISTLQEHDYMGLAEISSFLLQQQQQQKKKNLAPEKVEEADLQLGLAPPVQRKETIDPCLRFGVKRGYAEAMAEIRSSRLQMFDNFAGPSANNKSSLHVGWVAPKAQPGRCLGTYMPLQIHPALMATQQVHMARKVSRPHQETEDDTPSKSQIVGWPPVRSFRKTTLAANPNSTAEAEGVDSNGDSQTCLYVKVNMDGVPVGRKVDLGSYNSYEDLSHALIEMFQLPNSGQGDLRCPNSRNNDPSKPFHFHNDFSLTYEDKEGDWMLVGDVPWSIFLNTVCRLRIMKSS